MESYKERYNRLLTRYYNGCRYLKEHPDEIDKYLEILLKILDEMNIIIDENSITNSDNILKGF